MLEDSDNVPEVSDRSRLDKSLKVQRNHTISSEYTQWGGGVGEYCSFS